MYEVKYVHIYSDDKGKKTVSVVLACPGTNLGPLMGTWADHEVSVTVPFSNPAAVVPALKKRIAELVAERQEEAMFLSELKKALRRA